MPSKDCQALQQPPRLRTCWRCASTSSYIRCSRSKQSSGTRRGSDRSATCGTTRHGAAFRQHSVGDGQPAQAPLTGVPLNLLLLSSIKHTARTCSQALLHQGRAPGERSHVKQLLLWCTDPARMQTVPGALPSRSANAALSTCHAVTLPQHGLRGGTAVACTGSRGEGGPSAWPSLAQHCSKKSNAPKGGRSSAQARLVCRTSGGQQAYEHPTQQPTPKQRRRQAQLQVLQHTNSMGASNPPILLQ